MKIVELQYLYTYNYWARDRILENVAKLSLEQFSQESNYSHGSIRNTLVHILSAEWLWRVRCQEHISPGHFLAATDFPSPDSIVQAWAQEQDKMLSYLGTLRSEDLDKLVQYKRTGGETRENILWQLLLHVVIHGTEHRSTLASGLTAFGHSPGDIDFIRFLRAVSKK